MKTISESSTPVIRVGVVGVGSLGQHHARVYAELESAELVGLCDTDTERAREIAAAHNARVFTSIEELAEAVEAVSIAVPTDKHLDIARVFLDRGVHTLVEKPIATNTEEARQLVAAARARNLMLQVGHIERFNPVLGFLEDAEHQPRFIEAHRLSPYPPPRDGAPPRGTEVSVVLDLMIHDLEIILHLVDANVKSIHAVGVPVLSPTEDIANVRLSFENGCVANITASRISPEKMRKIRIFREDAYISLDYMSQEGEIYRKSAQGILRDRIPVEKDEPLKLELSAFVDCVARHDQPVVSGEQAARALNLAADILEQIQKEPT